MPVCRRTFAPRRPTPPASPAHTPDFRQRVPAPLIGLFLKAFKRGIVALDCFDLRLPAVMNRKQMAAPGAGFFRHRQIEAAHEQLPSFFLIRLTAVVLSGSHTCENSRGQKAASFPAPHLVGCFKPSPNSNGSCSSGGHGGSLFSARFGLPFTAKSVVTVRIFPDVAVAQGDQLCIGIVLGWIAARQRQGLRLRVRAFPRCRQGRRGGSEFWAKLGYSVNQPC